MKSLSSGTLADLAAEVLTMNTCILITRTDGAVYGWTDCDQPLTVSGQTYSPVDGYVLNSNIGKADFSVDNSEVVGFVDSPAITKADVAMGKWDYATVSLFMVNRNNIANGVYHMRDGWLGQVKIQAPGIYTAEIRGLSQVIQNTIGDLVTPLCRFKLGDSRCTVNLGSYTFTAAVTSVSSTQQFTASSLTQAAGYFAFGTMKWTAGNNNGVSMDIQGFSSGGIVLLQLPMLNTIQVGDTFSITAGCSKRFAQDCVAKFSNGINFGGFKDLPGLDKIMRPAGV